MQGGLSMCPIPLIRGHLKLAPQVGLHIAHMQSSRRRTLPLNEIFLLYPKINAKPGDQVWLEHSNAMWMGPNTTPGIKGGKNNNNTNNNHHLSGKE